MHFSSKGLGFLLWSTLPYETLVNSKITPLYTYRSAATSPRKVGRVKLLHSDLGLVPYAIIQSSIEIFESMPDAFNATHPHFPVLFRTPQLNPHMKSYLVNILSSLRLGNTTFIMTEQMYQTHCRSGRSSTNNNHLQASPASRSNILPAIPTNYHACLDISENV